MPAIRTWRLGVVLVITRNQPENGNDNAWTQQRGQALRQGEDAPRRPGWPQRCRGAPPEFLNSEPVSWLCACVPESLYGSLLVVCSGGHHPVEGQEGVGGHPRRGDGGVGAVRGGGVPFPDAGLLRGHDRHARLLHMDQRVQILQPVRPASLSS